MYWPSVQSESDVYWEYNNFCTFYIWIS